MKLNYKINVDMLELTYTCKEETKNFLRSIDSYTDEQETFRIIRKPKRHSYEQNFLIQYSYEWDFNNNCWRYKDLGYLKFDTSILYREENVFIEIKNEALYTQSQIYRGNETHYTCGFPVGCLAEYIAGYLGLEFYQVSKLDIAFDTNFDINRFIYRLSRKNTICILGQEIQYDLIIKRKKYRLEDKAKPPISWIFSGPRAHPLTDLEPTINYKSGSKRMKSYDKTLEIEENSHKNYIQAQWKKGQRIRRLEVSLDVIGIKAELKKLFHIDGEVPLDYQWKLLLSIYNESNLLETLFFQALERLIYVTTPSHRKKEKVSIIFLADKLLEYKGKLKNIGRENIDCYNSFTPPLF